MKFNRGERCTWYKTTLTCEESPPRRVKEVPTETWNNPPYPHGTQVTYKCRPGYIKIGRIAMECADGVWKQQGNTECRSKPCGHPGDTEFGSFQLTAGNEFVFGARVEYRCNDGYQMLSQKNYRECLAEGWSNDIPHCEVAKCLPVKAPENGRIVTSGAFELNREYSFGQVVEFECSQHYKLVGSKAIHCSSNGKWDSEVPQCQEIICNVPPIPNGFVRASQKTYRESEQLHYACNEGYTYGERADVQCTESGWYPTPYCIEVVCFPPAIRNGNFRPQKDRYTEGATITIDCNFGYRYSTLTDRNIAKCTSSGWVPAPGCVEKPCDYPAIENLRLSENLRWNYFPMRIGQSIYYHCLEGYSTPSGEYHFQIVCSQGGWKPEPACLKKCHARNLENGNIQTNWRNFYKEGDRAKFFCSANYRTENEDGEITCTKNGWSPTPRCIRKETCQQVDLMNGYFMMRQATFNLGETVTYRCYNDFVTPEGQEIGEIQCQKNGWSPPPKCIQSCKTSHIHFLTGSVRKNIYLPGDTLEYTCPEKFHTADNMPTGTARCDINGEWKPAPRCVAIECELPVPSNTRVSPKKGIYHNGDVVKFICGKNYVRVGPASAQCYYFGWFPSPPTCKVDPRDCGPPPEIINGNITGGFLEQYQHGNTVKYECDIQYKLVGSKEIECLDGQWSSPPSCIEDKMPCESPSSILNVVLHRQDQTQFSHGDEVTYGCRQGSGNASRMRTKCLNGEWKPLPLCNDTFHQCVPPKDIVLERTSSSPRQGKETGLRIRYKCKPADNQFKQATCVSGKWSPEIQCKGESTCPLPPQLPNANKITIRRNYKNGSKIAFSCLEGFHLIGANEITCVDGKWQSPPYCVEKPCLPPQPVEHADDLRLVNEHLKIEKEGKTVYLAGAVMKFTCHSGFELDGPSEISCSMGNWSSSPTCTEMSCGSIPNVPDSAIEGRNKEVYEPGETIRYQCNEGFEAVGLPEIICRRGNWSTPPFCEDVSCGAPPEVHDAYITSTQQQRYLPGAQVQYECDSNFQITGVNYITCSDGRWSQTPTCKDMRCGPPPEIAGGKVQGVKKSRYLPGETANYQCWQGFQMTGASTVSCQNGTWTELPTCKGKSGKCGPPPDIENGEILSFPLQEYQRGTTLNYKCPSLYILEGSQQITCINGQWTNPPVCLAACTASEEDMNINNIELKWRGERKLYSKSGDFIEFDCKIGNVRDPASSPFRVQCINGTLEYPLCNPGRDCTVLDSEMDKKNIKMKSFWNKRYTYRSKEYISFTCQWLYKPVSGTQEFNPQCLDGVIQYPQCA
ncbi:complement factor H isoform X3 [Numida meleagris]|uniref:complement factor H isoform X3 n=1 Tax=Numida meleagris TaxID=8996 RepID=UPI000B3DFFD4|nr:complement factor H isoform X3 [Numida meleagris]